MGNSSSTPASSGEASPPINFIEFANNLLSNTPSSKEQSTTTCKNHINNVCKNSRSSEAFLECVCPVCNKDNIIKNSEIYCRDHFTNLKEGFKVGKSRIEAAAAAEDAKRSKYFAGIFAKNTYHFNSKARYNANIAGDGANQARSYAGQARSNAGQARTNAGKASTNANQAGLYAGEAGDSAGKASDYATQTGVHAEEAGDLLNNMREVTRAFLNTTSVALASGLNASNIHARQQNLDTRQDTLNEMNLDMVLTPAEVEEHLFAFQSGGYPYLESLDEQQKNNILTHMIEKMQDSIIIINEYAEQQRQSSTPISNTSLPQWLIHPRGYIDFIIVVRMYYYCKYLGEGNGSETSEYQLFIKISDVIDKIFQVFFRFPPRLVLKLLNDPDNKHVKQYRYTYYLENKSKQGFANIKESFVANNIRNYIGDLQNDLNIDRTNLENSINNIKRYQDGEFLAQRDTIMNNVLMDYMINNEEGSNIEQVYGKLNQEKNDKLRKTKIAAYYTKSFKEYIYLLKIVIFLIVLMIPILIFNRLEILDKSLTLILVVTIITLGFLYISKRLYILYTRDNKDFDKFKIPFTRTEAARLKDNKSRYSKDSPLKSFGITCIGEECCDASMVYDKLRDKCVATENFGNYFENAEQLNNQQKNIIKENDSHEDESNFAFLGGNANVIENFRTKEGMKQGLLLESLNNSTERTF